MEILFILTMKDYGLMGHTKEVAMAITASTLTTLAVFVPFSVLYMKERIRLDYLWAGLCILGAVFFIFRQRLFGGA